MSSGTATGGTRQHRSQVVSSVSSSVLRVGLIAGIVAIATQTAAHLVWAYLWPAEFLNADNDASALAWASSVAAFVPALAACCLAAFRDARTGAWLALAAALALLSLDDVVAVHERLGGVADAWGLWDHANRAVGMVLIAPVLALAFVLAWQLTSSEAAGARRHVRAGLLLLAGAVLVEAVGSQLIRRAGSSGSEPAYLTEVVIEEGMELGGLILVGAGLAAMACATLVMIGERRRAADGATRPSGTSPTGG